MIGQLPRSLEVNGRNYAIRTDYRDVLKILEAFNDPDLKDEEKVFVCLFILFKNFEAIPRKDLEAAFTAALKFIDCGAEPGDKKRKSARTMDWEQDEALIFPAVNRVAGREVRALKYVHWWTFMGWFMEINDGVYASILSLRHKKAHGKKLEKWEREYWAANRDVCEIKPKYSEEEKAAQERLKALYS